MHPNRLTAYPLAPGRRPVLVAASKFDAPPPAKNHVWRSTVVERILRDSATRLVLLRAPAGFGKTTAMAQARQTFVEEGIATAWMTVDEADNDTARFLSCLSSAVQRVCPQMTSVVRRADQESSNVPGELALALIDTIRSSSASFALFIDEFEVVENSSVLSLVKEIIAHLPSGGRLVIASRTVPDLGLGRLRTKEQLLEIGQSDLRFSYHESRELVSQKRGVALHEAQMAKLHQCTEGWVTALSLASVTLERKLDPGRFISTFDGTCVSIADFLAEDVVSSLPPSLRDFLLKTSILPTLSAPLCDAVCERDNSAEMLAVAERQNLFLSPLDDKRVWYRYHGLFSDFLREQLEKEHPGETKRLRRRAAEWYLGQQRPIPAIDFALASGDTEFALPLMAEYAFRLLLDGRIRLVVRWLDAVPKAARSAYPILEIAHIWGVVLTRGQADALTMLEELEQRGTMREDIRAHAFALRPLLMSFLDDIDGAYETARQNAQSASPEHAFAYGLLMNSLAQLSVIQGKFDDARRIVTDTCALNGDRIGAFNHVFTETVESDIEFCRGNLRQATARLRQASRVDAGDAYPTNGNAKAGISLSAALYEADDWELAERLLNIYVPLIQELRLPDQLIASHVVLSRVCGIRGAHERAMQLLAELEHIGNRTRLTRAGASARLERARLALLDGHLAAAKDELSHAGSREFWKGAERLVTLANEVETLTVGRARYQIHSGAEREAIPLLQSALADAQRDRRERRALKLKILLAAAHYRVSNTRVAMRLLSQALNFGESEGFIRTFVEEGDLVMNMVREFSATTADGTNLAPESVSPSYLERVLKAEGKVTSSVGPVQVAGLMEALTPKELRVLQLLSGGYSNLDMATKLFVAETTVRTHLRSISAKLGAKNRTQIVSIARRAGLVKE